jgi:hypothetical protein
VRDKLSRIFPLFGSHKRAESDQNSWNPSAEGVGDAHFLRTWFEIDPDFDARRRLNRGTVMGVLIVFAVSGGFWTAVGLLAARLLR